MEQVLKWAAIVAMVAIGIHLALDRALEAPSNRQNTTTTELEGRASPDPSTVYQSNAPSEAVVIEAGRNGHFYLDALINNTSVPFVVDTGASVISLSHEAARRAGFRPLAADYTHGFSTANGVIKVAIITIDSVRYKDIEFNNVRAAIMPKGALNGANLLGNSFLSKLSEYKVSNGQLVMLP